MIRSASIVRVAGVSIFAMMLLAQAKAVAAAGGGAPTADSARKVAPRVRFDNPTFDFGEVRAADGVEHDFVFHNEGNAELAVTRVRIACSKCITIREFTKSVAPDATGRVALKLETYHMRERVSSTAWVHTNDPDQPQVRLRFVGRVIRAISVKPSTTAYFGRLSPDEVAVRELTLEVQREAPITITEAICTDKQIKTELVEVAPGRKYTLRISTAPPLRKGRSHASILLRTDDPKSGDERLRVSLNVPDRIHASPGRLYIVVYPNRDSKRILSLYSMDKAPVGITSLTIEPEGIPVKCVPVSPHARAHDERLQAKIELTVPAGPAPYDRAGRLVIETDDGEFPRIIVPIQFRDMPGPARDRPISGNR